MTRTISAGFEIISGAASIARVTLKDSSHLFVLPPFRTLRPVVILCLRQLLVLERAVPEMFGDNLCNGFPMLWVSISAGQFRLMLRILYKRILRS